MESIAKEQSSSSSATTSINTDVDIEIFSASTGMEFGWTSSVVNTAVRETTDTNTKSQTTTTTIGPIDISPGDSVYIFEKTITFPSISLQTNELTTSSSPNPPQISEEATMCIPVNRATVKYVKNIVARSYSSHTYSKSFIPFRLGYTGQDKDVVTQNWGDINRGFGGDHVYLELSWTEDPNQAADKVKLILSNNWLEWVSERGQTDMARGSGGKYRFLDVWHRREGCKEKIIDVVLWEGELGRVPDGWTDMTIDLNRGRRGRYLYIVWKSVTVS